MPELRLVPADEVAPADLHALFLAAFADYVAGAPQLPLEHWPRLLARHGVDLPAGRVVLRGDEPVAFALACLRPDVGRWRLAAMGALPAARGTGAAVALLDDLAHRARAAGARELELECFAQNERALRRYGRHGFVVVAELFGYDRGAVDHDRAAGDPTTPAADGARPRPTPPGASQTDVAVLDRSTTLAAFAAAQAGVADVPYQTTARGLAAVGDGLVGWRRGAALVALDPDAAGRVALHALFDPDPLGRDADALVGALVARFPDRPVTAIPIHRDDLGAAALRRAGFAPQALHQVLMVAPLP